MSKFQNDLTKGSVAGQLIKFSIPFLISNLLQALYSVADMVIVGNAMGPIGVADVQMGSQVTMLLTNIVIGLGAGATVLVAQYQGANRPEDQKKTISTVFTMYFILGLVCTVLMLLINKPILNLLSAEEISEGAIAYLDVCSLGYIFIFGYNAVSGILRGMGDSKRPLYFVAIAAITNIVLDIILVSKSFGIEMGAAGAAWATISSQAISFILSAIYLKFSGFVFDFKPKSFKLDFSKLKLICKVGLPSAVQFSITGFSFLTLTGLSSQLDPEVGNALLGIGSKLNSFGILPCVAMCSSISSMAGQNIGAGEFKRAKKCMWVGLLIALSVALVAFIIINIFPEQVIHIFMDGDNLTGKELENYKKCMEIGSTYIRLCSIDYVLACFFFACNGLAMGSGHTVFALVNTAIMSLGFRMPLAYLFSLGLGWGLNGVAAALGLAPIVPGIIGLLYVQSGRWKKSRLGITANIEG